ncbi:MAG TPA: DUF2442 domain-containing protein [Thiobacillaceae bacterium]|nr:DUF2442 domain-containing protein [Thiobacillaceae bacterium]
MILHVDEMKHLEGYRLLLTFNNGESGTVDLNGLLEGEVFAPLNDPESFATARLDPLFKTVVWSNGADMAPEYLLDLVREQARRAA